MTAVDLARLQFATTTSIHWLFVMVTLGLVVVVVTLQTRALLTRDARKRELLYRMTRYWGLLYVINYALGIASGIIMEFQFGTNWSGLSHVVGNVFGAPLAMETLVAFVAESTFLALWIFGWNKLPQWLHTLLIWLVMIAAYASALWVLVANGFMQNPVGFEMSNGQADLVDAAALFSNPSMMWALVHIVGASLAAGGVIVVVVSAAYLFRRTAEQDFFVRSFRLGYLMGLIGMTGAFGTGWAQYAFVQDNQPAKALDTMTGGAEAAAVQQQLVAQFGPGDYLAGGAVFGAFLLMMTLGQLAFPAMVFMSPIVIWKLPAKLWWAMPVFWIALPVPFLAAIAGWVFREMGRQPWIVYGVQRTEEAFSGHSTATMWTSFVVFTTVLLTLLITNWTLLTKHARRGPNREIFGVPATAPPAMTPHPIHPVVTGARHG
jgi:cytochrome d ubiquinol oxidase subunit I